MRTREPADTRVDEELCGVRLSVSHVCGRVHAMWRAASRRGEHAVGSADERAAEHARAIRHDRAFR